MYILEDETYKLILNSQWKKALLQRSVEFKELYDWLLRKYSIIPLHLFSCGSKVVIVLNEAYYRKIMGGSYIIYLKQRPIEKEIMKLVGKEKQVIFVNFEEEMQMSVLMQLSEKLGDYTQLYYSDCIWKIYSPGVLNVLIIFYYTEDQKIKKIGEKTILKKVEEIISNAYEYPLLVNKHFYSIAEESKEELDLKYEGNLLYYTLNKF